MLSVVVPPMTVQVAPQKVVALDVAPYNDFSLTCSARNPIEMIHNISLEFVWLAGSIRLLHGRDGVTITSMNSSRSMISLVASGASLYNITCRVRVVLLNDKQDELFLVEQMSGVDIRG